ncbi:MAG: YqeG family HAD IIIA-type phosphatase [Thermotogae bacterium]|nr:YqeG family HAD IIIA-type phosphatase [Thermotogota bacterium]
MHRGFLPREQTYSIFTIDYERLKRMNYEVILFDLDNTLIPWKRFYSRDGTNELFERLNDMGFRIAIVTNANFRRTEKVSHFLEGQGKIYKVYSKLHKPFKEKMMGVLAEMNVKPERCAMVGDLVFTDILLGNRLGMYTILVTPFSDLTSPVIKVIHYLERFAYYAFSFTIGRLEKVFKSLSADEQHLSVYDIDYEKLKKWGFEFLVFDFDNTLVPRGSNSIPVSVFSLFRRLKDKGFKLIILSNGMKSRLNRISGQFDDIQIIGGARKPFRGVIKRVLKQMEGTPDRTVIIGDQIFTDVLLGKRLKCYTILVEPASKKDLPYTKFMRFLEKPFRRRLK